MIGAFVIDDPGRKGKVLYAKAHKTHYRQQNGGNGQAFAWQVTVYFGFNLFFVHTAYSNVI